MATHTRRVPEMPEVPEVPEMPEMPEMQEMRSAAAPRVRGNEMLLIAVFMAFAAWLAVGLWCDQLWAALVLGTSALGTTVADARLAKGDAIDAACVVRAPESGKPPSEAMTWPISRKPPMPPPPPPRPLREPWRVPEWSETGSWPPNPLFHAPDGCDGCESA